MPMRLVSGRDPDYEFMKTLGSGGMGTVAKVRRVQDNKIMACKTIDCSSSPEIYKYAQAEVSTWAAVSKNKYIARFSNDWSWNPSSKIMRLYMDFYEGGDLQNLLDHLRHEEQQLHPVVALLFALHIAQGVELCHDASIMHRDLKPANVLLKQEFNVNDIFWAAYHRQRLTDDQFTRLHGMYWRPWEPNNLKILFEDAVVIADFGLGKFNIQDNTRATYSMMGTPGYMPPESVGPTGTFSSKSDIFSLGCLLHALFSGKGPTSTTLGRSQISQFENYPAIASDIVKQCLENNPEGRPCIEDVIQALSNAVDEAILSFNYKGMVDHMKDEFYRQLRIKYPPDTRPKAVRVVEEMGNIVGKGLSRMFS